MTTCIYADSLLDKFKAFSGRIGLTCDDCSDKKCQHNGKKLDIEQMGNGYAMNLFTQAPQMPQDDKSEQKTYYESRDDSKIL